MITRSQSRRNNVIKEIKMADSNEMSEEFEINNQLGVEHSDNSDSNLEIGAGGLNSDTSVNMLQIIMEQINKKFDEVKKNNEELNQQTKEMVEQNNKRFEETIKLISNKLDSTTQRLEKLIHVEVGAVRASLEEQSREFHEKMKQQRKEINGSLEKTERRIDSINKNNVEIRNSVMEIRSEININQENNNKKLNEINTKINNTDQNNERLKEKITSLAEEKGRRIEEINNKFSTVTDQINRRIESVETRPYSRPVNDNQKELTYNGDDPFPIEFLKELDELKELYYHTENINWISKHLTGEAAIWWRIVKQTVKTYAEFKCAFTAKFWGENEQQMVRDRLEYAKFKPNGTMTAIQYIERQVLQCRQLVPAMSEQHIIKKLARHFNKEIELAILTRGICDINAFENLVREFMIVTGRDEYKRHSDQSYRHRSNHIAPGENSPKNEWKDGRREENMHLQGHKPFKKYDGYDRRRQEIDTDGARQDDNKFSKGFKRQFAPKVQTIVGEEEHDVPSYSKNDRFTTTPSIT